MYIQRLRGSRTWRLEGLCWDYPPVDDDLLPKVPSEGLVAKHCQVESQEARSDEDLQGGGVGQRHVTAPVHTDFLNDPLFFSTVTLSKLLDITALPMNLLTVQCLQ